MIWFFVFVFIVAMIVPSEMKTMEQMENELDFLKMKMESFEDKTDKTKNDTEERLDYLEEMAKLNVIRTCDEMSQFGITASNYYFVDPDGPLTGADPFRVYCQFTELGEAITEVLHNSEELIEITHCAEPGCYAHSIIYTAPQSQIQSLISLSHECEQSIRYDCLLAPLMANDINFGYWLDKNGESNVYWDGSHGNQHVCSCFYQEEGCLDQNTKNTTCNCDAAAPVMAQDMGSITNKTALPLTQVNFGGMEYEMQQGFHAIGRLRCWGKAAYQEGTSCSAIKRSGQYQSGFFNIRKNETENSQLVFCNQTATPGYEDNSESQQFIESSEDHFNIVQEDMEKIENDVTENEGRISTSEGKISTLENDVTSLQLKSSYCAYQDDWYDGKDNKVITYNSLFVDYNNIDGASFNIGTGQFTAGSNGVYTVEFTIGRMYEPSTGGEITDIYIRRNGINIGESRLYQRTVDTDGHNNDEVAGRSMLVNMERGDTLEAYGTKISDIMYVTFCISLIK